MLLLQNGNKRDLFAPQVLPMKHCFKRDRSSLNERGDYVGELQQHELDDQQGKALVDALKAVRENTDIKIVNMSLGYKYPPDGLDKILGQLYDEKILIASAG